MTEERGCLVGGILAVPGEQKLLAPRGGAGEVQALSGGPGEALGTLSWTWRTSLFEWMAHVISHAS